MLEMMDSSNLSKIILLSLEKNLLAWNIGVMI